MDLPDIERINRATLQAIEEGRADPNRDAYYGYFQADLFDCPPFLMFTNNDCHRAHNILYSRRFEPASMKLWCALARGATSIVDVGAQVGVYTLAAAALRRDLPIHAFEPNPYAYARLRVNLQVNKFDNVVEHPIALGHRDDAIIEINWSRRPGEPISSGAVIGRYPDKPGIEIVRTVGKMTRFDSAVPELGDRGLIKIDVEGAEPVVFDGMRARLESRPDIILETFHPDSVAYIKPIIEPLGYAVYGIDEDTGTLKPQAELVPLAGKGSSFNQFLTARPLDPPITAMLGV